ncbi:cyclophilin type peptidyl-prolyl cis-trans isomerase [Mycolicibacterium mageritense DSM 44476 = CIP 104973]|uniref:Peptidyl-prolyl cis-trans isomerase n=1 Tax=Mycolicibacterium mageritense TaxID=53462 RepID=A0AAI8TZ05_MYCME|nr:peptidylprolyl isomerase [Mycolicibacterium mageritense]MBN3456669.1 peptidylprolyl isomerase [Mycobacterium sp. DSM 3803]MCC9184631.1 peptidylprolyl isomerase [Mycolicibacterium mageritense]TXI58005.1 MAG: peptidylprolyl isomerase [Mycolicibacterium mageritense]CDO26313.1 PpiB [Mycolicibacterium mageritense DSM 44476 = CIP 104973]BBX36680.1 peptidyl-prolyl cis-trans isomerase [Mycolicibacterium mageritense]
MPTNEQRRAAAKRKLERQLERRAAKARKQRIFAITGTAVVAVAAIAAVVTLVVVNRDSGSTTASAATTTPGGPAPTGVGENCQYPAAQEKASKQVNPPRTGKVPTDPATVSVSMVTTQGNIGLQLDNAKAPCTVNSFASLASQNYFNDTPCHRLTTGGLSVLQCGDPTGKGTGGPGYQFADEYPATDFPPGSPESQQPISYPRGTLAMANAGPGTNGSQFFLVYKDSQLPPNYTKFGTIDETGLATLDKIAAGGVAGGGTDGAPATPVEIKSVALD